MITTLLVLGVIAIPWSYILARMVTRAVIRSIEERKIK